MQVFEVLSTIETKEIHGTTFEHVIKPGKIYLLTDDVEHSIYIYPSENPSIIQKCVGRRLAREIKKVMRGFYRIKDKLEETDLEPLKSTIITEGKVPELYNPNMIDPENSDQKITLATKTSITQKYPWWQDISFSSFDIFTKEIKSKTLPMIFENMKSDEIWQQNLPDLLLKGSGCYIFQKELKNFIPEKEYKIQPHLMGNLPDGWTFLKDFTPRFQISRGRINFIDLYQIQNEKDIEILDIPSTPLPFPRISKQQEVQILKQAFKIPESPRIEEILNDFYLKSGNTK